MTHEEVIKILREVHDNALFSVRTALETICPELKESEDERMINELQGFLCSYGSDYFGNGKWQKFDDWLEKQKEQREATPETCLKGIIDFDDISQLELAVDCYKEKKGRAYPVTVKHQHEVLMKLYDLIGIDREALDQDKEVE